MGGSMGKTRRAVPLKLRFEIFKRDSFMCRYCGRRPPEIVLHVEHVVAVANGGDNSPANLVTSCGTCNIGKGTESVATTELPAVSDEGIARMQADANRLRAMAMAHVHREQAIDELEAAFRTKWGEAFRWFWFRTKDGELDGHGDAEPPRPESIKSRLRDGVEFPLLVECIEITRRRFYCQYRPAMSYSEPAAYFFGVLRKKLDAAAEAAQNSGDSQHAAHP